jgi:hypothetical protein
VHGASRIVLLAALDVVGCSYDIGRLQFGLVLTTLSLVVGSPF